MITLFFSFILIFFDQIENKVYASQVDEKNPKDIKTLDEFHEVEIFFFQKGTGRPLKRVEIKILDQVFYSDTNGLVKLRIQKNYKESAEVYLTGYDVIKISASYLLSHKNLEIYLEEDLARTNRVIIKGKKKQSVSRKEISIEESEKVAPGGDSVQVIRLLPGVQSQAFRKDIIIRGSGPDDSKYYVDKLEVPFIFHPIGNLSVFPSPLLSDIQFDSGGFSSRFGDATGGIIVLKTKSDVPKYPETQFIVNLPLYSGVYHEHPVAQDAFYAVSIRRSYLDLFIKLALKIRGEDQITFAPHFTDAHGFYFKKTESGYWKTTLMGSDDGFYIIAPPDPSANEQLGFQLSYFDQFFGLGVENQRRLSRRWALNLAPQIFYNLSKFNLSATRFSSEQKVEYTILTFRTPIEISYKLSKKEKLSFGLDPRYAEYKRDISIIRSEGRNTAPSEEEQQEDFGDDNTSRLVFWLSLEQVFGSFKVIPEGRVFYNRQIKKTGFDPRLISSYELTDQHRLKLSVGQYSKHPEREEASSGIGNTDLNFEKSMHYVVGLETVWSDTWESDIQLYYKDSKNLIEDDPNENFINKGEQKSQGLEIFIRHKMTDRFFGWISYTYSRSEKKDHELNRFFLTSFDQSHFLNFVGSYKITSLWEVVLRYNHQTGRPYTPIDFSIYDVNQDLYVPRRDPEKKNSFRLPDYNNISLYLVKDFLYNTWKLSLKFGLETYWPTDQVLKVQNNYDFSKQEYLNGFTVPFLELKGIF